MTRDLVLLVLQHLAALLYIWLCPFTKVEESFNLQAMHDLLTYKGNISNYDHHDFPGVVPRTFIGPLVVSALSLPITIILQFVGLKKIVFQYVVRAVLATLFLHGMKKFQDSVRIVYGPEVFKYFIMITLSQFHLLFYASRPLPNIFAMVLVLHALSAWLRNKIGSFIWISAFAILVFRAELSIFLGLCLGMSLLQDNSTLLKIIKISIPAGIFSLLVTILIDSWFWKRLIWPEGEVLFFNAVLNKSAQWGTSPFLWYFYSALPRLLLTSFLVFPLSFYYLPGRASTLAIPAIGYILLYSFLPHKELRFIIYTVPIFNTLAATVYTRMEQQRTKSYAKRLMYLFLLGLLVVNLLGTAIFASASYHNYPGGYALQELHNHVPCSDGNLRLHIDNYAAQTGVSRFGQLCDNWIYDKTENIDEDVKKMRKFTHLIAESSTKKYKMFVNEGTHDMLEVIEGYEGIGIKYAEIYGIPIKIPYVSMKLGPKIFILERI